MKKITRARWNGYDNNILLYIQNGDNIFRYYIVPSDGSIIVVIVTLTQFNT